MGRGLPWGGKRWGEDMEALLVAAWHWVGLGGAETDEDAATRFCSTVGRWVEREYGSFFLFLSEMNYETTWLFFGIYLAVK